MSFNSLNKNEINVFSGSTSGEMQKKNLMAQCLRNSSVPDSELLDNVGLYLTRQSLSRINFIQEIYNKILPVHGVIMEFGVRWGQNMALFSNLRGMHEPFNYNRKIIGFDTFSGFPSVSVEDGGGVKPGDYGVTNNYMDELNGLLEFHEQNSPVPHKSKFELVKGDAIITFPDYLGRHPETIVALAYFDFDLYAPTKVCLENLLPYLTRGSILAFDELNCPEFPGETVAVREVLGISKYAIRRSEGSPLTSYCVIE